MQTHHHLKGHVFSRGGLGADEDRWTVTRVYFEHGMIEAHAVLQSEDGEAVELPVSHLRPPFLRSVY